jgi:HSP20 family protein
MSVVRWNPVRNSINSEMVDRLLDGFMGRDTISSVPAVRVWEDAETYTVQAIVPGLDRESLDIQAAPNGLSITGKFNYPVPEGVTVRHSEYGNGEFRRMIQLATQVRSEAVKANYNDGILTIHLPKIESQRVVKVRLEGDTLS